MGRGVADEPFPLGATLTRAILDSELHAVGRRLRRSEPVTWAPAFNGWFVTRRDLVVEILEDVERFTVDDPRFAVKQVMGPNMLALDGAEHQRHREPFEPDFKMSAVRHDLLGEITDVAARLISDLSGRGQAELRRDLGAPLAVRVVGGALGLDIDPAELLGWYDEIVIAMAAVSDGFVDDNARPQVLDNIGDAVRSASAGRSALLTTVARRLPMDDVVANAAVVLFGGIETSETMTASVFAHLLGCPDVTEIVETPGVLVKAIDESLRLEPAVAQIDRFATRDTELDGVRISNGDFVICSVTGANRDPAFYPEPDRFDPRRSNARTHMAFAKGPHTCLGMHLARAETRIAVETAFSMLPDLRLDNEVEWSGSVFRKPHAVQVRWGPDQR